MDALPHNEEDKGVCTRLIQYAIFATRPPCLSLIHDDTVRGLSKYAVSQRYINRALVTNAPAVNRIRGAYDEDEAIIFCHILCG